MSTERPRPAADELAALQEQLAALQDELAEKTAELERDRQRRSEILGMAAHDLRSPLATVSGFAQYLATSAADRLSAEERHILGRIVASASRMISIVDDMLSVSLIESGKVELSLSDVDLADVLTAVVEIESHAAAAKEIDLRVEGPEVEPHLEADPDRLTQLLANLVSNAVKFSPPRSTVVIAVVPSEGTVRIEVRDHGPGIPADEVEALFEPFSRTSVQATAGERSTGLGLAIARSIVAAHEGEIGVETVEGEGSTFWVRLPESVTASAQG